MRKRFIYKATFLFIMLLFCLKSCEASSNFNYKLDSNNYAIISSYNGTSREIIIPNTIDGYEVKKIEAHAFDENRNTTRGKNITKVTIEEGITEIGDFAFTDCINLESVTLPKSLKKMGWQCFQNCSKLSKINIPSNLTNLAAYSFQGTALKEIVIPKNINKLNSGVFRLCAKLKAVVVYNPDLQYYTELQSGQKIDENPFEDCSQELVLYGYLNSTTEEYAKKHGIIFKDISTYSSDIEVATITLNKKDISLYVGESTTITAAILPQNATNKLLMWSSDNKKIVSVEDGKITANSEGIAIITVTSHDGKTKAICKVTVKTKPTIEQDNKEIKVQNITINVDNLVLKIGEHFSITAIIEPENSTNKDVKWSSSNEKIVSVKDGKVTAITEGNATITVTTVDGNFVSTCVVTVEKPIQIPIQDEIGEVQNENGVIETPLENINEQGTNNAVKQQSKLGTCFASISVVIAGVVVIILVREILR